MGSNLLVIITLISAFFIPLSYAHEQESGPEIIVARFDSLSGLNVGAKVLVKGEQCGTVSDIQNNTTGDNLVIMNIVSNCRGQLRKGTVAIISSQSLTSENSSEGQAVELVVSERKKAKLLAEKSEIKGFSSYAKMWAAG